MKTIDLPTRPTFETDSQAETAAAPVLDAISTTDDEIQTEGLPTLEEPARDSEEDDFAPESLPVTDDEIQLALEPEEPIARTTACERSTESGPNGDVQVQQYVQGAGMPEPPAEFERQPEQTPVIDARATETPTPQPNLENAARPESPGAGPRPEPRPKTKVLVVDDDLIMRKLLKIGLAPFHYECVTAENGKVAQEILRTFHPDLMLVDLLMPVMDGLAFIRWLRETVHDSTPVLVFTNISDSRIAKEALRCGANSFASKPLHVKGLLEAMKKLVPA